MLDWFKALNPAVQAAIIGAFATIIVPIIAGIFSLIKSRTDNHPSTIIKQTQGIGNKGTQIGIQNNTTIKFGDTTVDDGTIIIDGGTASGGGGIRYEPPSNNDKSGVNKNE